MKSCAKDFKLRRIIPSPESEVITERNSKFSNGRISVISMGIKAGGGATARHGPPKILKNYFILCISIKKFKYLATKIEVSPLKCLS